MTRVDSVKTGRGRRRNKKRSGMLSAELIMALPILAIVIFGLFEFALLFTARGELSEASRVAARKATMPGVTYEAVEEEIRRVLSPRLQRTMEVSIDQGQRSGDVVTVFCSQRMSGLRITLTCCDSFIDLWGELGVVSTKFSRWSTRSCRMALD